MISEVAFATRFNALWAALTPLMEHFVRTVNLNLYERYEAPIETFVGPGTRAIVSEAAFVAYGKFIVDKKNASMQKFLEENFTYIIDCAYQRIESMRGVVIDIDLADDKVKEEIYQLTNSIEKYFVFVENSPTVEISPSFVGCGYLDQCQGDFRTENLIIEMKNVERNFRATDFRQLLVYCVLSYAAKNVLVKSCALLNARRGIYWKDQIGNFTRACSGKAPNVLFDEIVYAISSGDISR